MHEQYTLYHFPSCPYCASVKAFRSTRYTSVTGRR